MAKRSSRDLSIWVQKSVAGYVHRFLSTSGRPKDERSSGGVRDDPRCTWVRTEGPRVSVKDGTLYHYVTPICTRCRDGWAVSVSDKLAPEGATGQRTARLQDKILAHLKVRVPPGDWANCLVRGTGGYGVLLTRNRLEDLRIAPWAPGGEADALPLPDEPLFGWGDRERGARKAAHSYMVDAALRRLEAAGMLPDSFPLLRTKTTALASEMATKALDEMEAGLREFAAPYLGRRSLREL